MRYAIEMAYKGTGFHGWQRQPNAATVQQALEEKLSLLLRERIGVTGAGRTDTGVHAAYYTAHFDAVGRFGCADLAYRLNSVLPTDITVFFHQ